MNNRFNFLWILIAFLGMLISTSCEKQIDPFPNSSEAISFSNIDTTTITAKAGEIIEINVVLITDTVIDKLQVGYFLDTVGITHNITYLDIKTELVNTGFDEINNKHQYLAKLQMPSNAYGIRPFRPFLNNVGDYTRLIFRMEAGSKEFEKQLKVIMTP